MKMRPIAAMTLAGTMMALAACGGGEKTEAAGGGACAPLTIEFEGDKTVLSPKPRAPIVAAARKAVGACPQITIASYPAGGDEETARRRMNHVKNVFQISDLKHPGDKITAAVVDAPSDDLAGKVQVSFSAE